jgi:hypothetical protein
MGWLIGRVGDMAIALDRYCLYGNPWGLYLYQACKNAATIGQDRRDITHKPLNA